MEEHAYARALEEQVSLLRWLNSSGGTHYSRHNYRQGVRAEMLKGLLAQAEPYYWAPNICALLTDSAATLPDWAVQPSDLPGNFGYWWFEDALPLPGVMLDTSRAARLLLPDTLRALVWGHSTFERAEAERLGVDPAPGGLLIYALTETQARPSGLPGLTWLWNYGRSWRALTLDAAEENDAGQPLYGYEIENERLRAMTRYLAAGLLFCQDVLEARGTRVPRPTLRRIERERATPPRLIANPSVRVITLRRKVSRGIGLLQPVQWSCQWSVRGHWRHQYYPSEGRHRPVWVRSYWKGPAEAPIKPPSARLFRVTR